MKLKDQINEFLLAFSDDHFFEKHGDDFMDVSFMLDWSEETQIAFMAAKIIYDENRQQRKQAAPRTHTHNTNDTLSTFEKYAFPNDERTNRSYTGMKNGSPCLKYTHDPLSHSKKIIPLQDIM